MKEVKEKKRNETLAWEMEMWAIENEDRRKANELYAEQEEFDDFGQEAVLGGISLDSETGRDTEGTISLDSETGRVDAEGTIRW